ncbi:beta-1 adrenergic receptor-like [Eublepharis macularius]|uniref:Beta-1 adrenergic receptor-like n=1 Tax=Eublepharis macularius TaxID=481883 RepID=A0AA97KHE2_EUBMA|nr:beta-1 adrenergic receptor-like [Eublepharis macularius]
MSINYALAFSWLIGLILTIGFSANVLAVVLAIKYSSMKKNQLDILLLSMAAADLITLILMPFVLASVIHYTWFWGDAFCKFFQFCSAFSLAGSIYSLCAVSIARARIISGPYRAPKSTNTIFMLTGVWVLSLAVSLPLRIHATMETRFSTNVSFCLPTVYQQHYQVVFSQFVLYYLIPVLVIAFNYLRLVLFLHKSPVMSWEPGGISASPGPSVSPAGRPQQSKSRPLPSQVPVMGECEAPVGVQPLLHYCDQGNCKGTQYLLLGPQAASGVGEETVAAEEEDTGWLCHLHYQHRHVTPGFEGRGGTEENRGDWESQRAVLVPLPPSSESYNQGKWETEPQEGLES